MAKEKPKTRINNKGKTQYLNATGTAYHTIREPKEIRSYTTTAGEKVAKFSDGSQKRTPKGGTTSTFGTPMVSSQQGKNLVREADTTIENLAPMSALPQEPTSQQASPNTPTVTQQSTPAPEQANQQSGNTQQNNDFLTYVNESTGQEQTLRGTAINDSNKKNLEAQGYSLLQSDTSQVEDTPEIKQAKVDMQQAESSVMSFMSRLESMLVTDKELSGEIRSIKSGYNARANEMREITARREQAIKTLGTRLGARYTGGMGGILGGIISEEERQGLMRIEQIENDKQDAIIKAKKAARDTNFSVYTQLASKAEKLQERKAQELKDLQKAQKEQNDKLAKEKQEMEWDALISEQLGTGETDPLKIVQALGGKVPFDKIKALTELMPKPPEDFTLSEGQARYDAKGNLIASRAKTYAPTSGDPLSADGSLGISDAAKEIIKQIDLGANIDDLIKGSSIAAQTLRNEVIAGLNAKGGVPEKSISLITEAKSIVDSMITDEVYKAMGGYSSILGGQFSLSYGDAMAQAEQLQAMLARDNLGLLKGAMSDKDLAFIQSMSSGFDGKGTQSEEYIKERLEAIQTKLSDRLAKTSAPEFKKEMNETVNMSNKDLFNTGSWATQSSTDASIFSEIGLDE